MSILHPKVAIIQFPGSNCDADCLNGLREKFAIKAKLVWHQETVLPKVDGVIIPGGFSFGDYVRAGVLAAHSPVMRAIKEFAKRGGVIFGICNGFQILTEAHLLPGALLRNISGKFVCKNITLRNEIGQNVFQKSILQAKKNKFSIPVAHAEGRYYADSRTLDELQEREQILFRYVDENLEVTEAANFNGSSRNIAGVCDAKGKIFGMMPHPERALFKLTGGSDDGVEIWNAFFTACQ